MRKSHYDKSIKAQTRRSKTNFLLYCCDGEIGIFIPHSAEGLTEKRNESKVREKPKGTKKLPDVEYQTERLDHLGIVAGAGQEAGRAAWLDAQANESRRDVSVGTAVVAMILNGLGFANRQLYLVPQYFANKPVEHLLGCYYVRCYEPQSRQGLNFKTKQQIIMT